MFSVSTFNGHLSNVYVIWTCIIIVYALNFVSVYTKYLMPVPRMKAETISTVSWQGTRKIMNSLSLQDIKEEKIQNKNLTYLYKFDELSVNNATAYKERSFINRTRLSKTRSLARLGLKHKNATIHATAFSKTRPYTCNNCFETYLKFDSSNICSTNGRPDQVDIMILITTSHSHIRNRKVLRSTWLTYTGKNTKKVRYVFLLGNKNDTSLSKQIQFEKRKYNDIVIANFTDSYTNLTYKTLSGFKWVQSFCPQARWVMKTDDDVFINVGSLIDLTNRHPKTLDQTMIGACWVRKPIREERSKYFISNSTYPNSTYPKVCSGTGYVTSYHVIKQILSISPNIPFFHLEDVYVAFCLHQLGLSPKRHRGFLTPSLRKEVFSMCASKSKTVISTHVGNSLKIALLWKFECPSNQYSAPLQRAGDRLSKEPHENLNRVKYRKHAELNYVKYRKNVNKNPFKFRFPVAIGNL